MEGECIMTAEPIYAGTRKPRAARWFVRYLHECYVGPIPAGFHVHHVCKHGWCVNWRHLQALSPADHIEQHRERPELRKVRYPVLH